MLKRTFHFLVRNEFYRLISFIFILFIIKKESRSNQKSEKTYKLLFLNKEKFRGDIEALSKNIQYDIFSVSNTWTCRLLSSFKEGKIDILQYHNMDSRDYGRLFEIIDNFYLRFTYYIKKYKKFDCIIIPNYRYTQDYTLVKAFKKNGLPIILFYRECLIITERVIDFVTNRHKLFKGYPVDHVIVHNNISKESLISSKFVDKDNISVGGALRIDYLIDKLKQVKYPNNKKYNVTLFYFPYDTDIFGFNKPNDNYLKGPFNYLNKLWPYREKLFLDLHTALIDLACENKDIDITIKAKKEAHVKKGVESLQKYLKLYNNIILKRGRINNYRFTTDANVHELIIKSDLIIGLQSTAILESAIAEKAIIFPLFYKFSKTDYFNEFNWRNYLDLFEVAYDQDHLKELIIEKVNKNAHIEKSIMRGRKELFIEYFNQLDGSSLKKYSAIIDNKLSNYYKSQ